ncbi:MAG TPA: pyridoxamine 5'-phosphate oxidase family protein [Nakamurella sp.]
MTEPTATTTGDLSHLRDVIDRYRTCELATISKSGVPIAWPTVFELSPAGNRIVLTTSITFPQKAFNIRRDPRVALLFSDPTGAGRTDLPQILVRGTAVCPPEIHAGTDGLEGYWRRLARLQPASRGYGGTAVGRWLFDWYYLRLVITVTPHEVTIHRRPPGNGSMVAPAPARSDHSAYARLSRQLPGFTSAVLGTVGPGEMPELRRVTLRADRATGTFLVDGPDVGAASSGPASLLLHRHDDLLWNQQQVVATGTLTRSADRCLFRPERVLPNQFPKNPVEMGRVLVRARRAAHRYLEHRGLDRPAIDWAAHRACEHDAATGS